MVEAVGGEAEGLFWIDFEVASEVDYREQEIADLVGVIGVVGKSLGEFLVHLGDRTGHVRPVEPDTGGASLQRVHPRQ